jgi:hypothetical protein
MRRKRPVLRYAGKVFPTKSKLKNKLRKILTSFQEDAPQDSNDLKLILAIWHSHPKIWLPATMPITGICTMRTKYGRRCFGVQVGKLVAFPFSANKCVDKKYMEFYMETKRLFLTETDVCKVFSRATENQL